MSTALGDAGRERAIASIANQMRTLLASDVLYAQVVEPEIDGVSPTRGSKAPTSPTASSSPTATRVARRRAPIDDVAGPGQRRLGRRPRQGSTAPACSRPASTAVDPHRRHPGRRSRQRAPGVDVQVQNQGESEESGVTVRVRWTAARPRPRRSARSRRVRPQTATMPLPPTPSGQVTLDVEVDAGPRRGDHRQQRGLLHGHLRLMHEQAGRADDTRPGIVALAPRAVARRLARPRCAASCSAGDCARLRERSSVRARRGADSATWSRTRATSTAGSPTLARGGRGGGRAGSRRATPSCRAARRRGQPGRGGPLRRDGRDDRAPVELGRAARLPTAPASSSPRSCTATRRASTPSRSSTGAPSSTSRPRSRRRMQRRAAGRGRPRAGPE